MTVAFQNKGLLDLRGITTFGLSVKATDNPIGYFGTGLKYAIAVCLKHGCCIELWLGEDRFDFDVRSRMFRDQEANVIFMDGKELPFTENLGMNWELWMAYRELAANAFDEEDNWVTSEGCEPKDGYTTFVVSGEKFDNIHEERSQIFLQTKPAYVLTGLEIHDDLDAGGWIYHKGIRVYKLAKRALYNYNVTSTLRLTEDRTVTSLSDIHIAIAKALVNCNKPALIRQILLANNQFFESTIDYHWWSVKPGETFNVVVAQYIGSRTSINTSARDVYRRDHPKAEIPDTIQIELIPIEQRRKLWAAHAFWTKLGIEIPRGVVGITTELGTGKGKVVAGRIYLSKFVLEMDMRFIAGYLYKLFAETKPTIGNIKQEDLLIDTIVDFGERLLGVSKEKAA